jgi:hypothetical protein
MRTNSNYRCKLSLWLLALLNHTKIAEYENGVSEPKTPQVINLQYSYILEKAAFIREFQSIGRHIYLGKKEPGGGIGTGIEPSPSGPT